MTEICHFFFFSVRLGDAARTQAGSCAFTAFRITCSNMFSGRSSALSD